ncbi:uncharacterized protein LOC134246804 [Saccostrea cucullata]|uniref:uncharacterized protein LOC134246804 n=1 Tax=Saccostrea cuccullata TaxID=36930 RepID=UPI002ED13854
MSIYLNVSLENWLQKYLLQALQLSPSKYAQESIQLQHQFHLRQQEAIQDKIIRVEKMNNKLANKGSEVKNQSTQTEAKLMFSPNHFLDDHISQESNDRIMQALVGTDSLVGHLLLKNKFVSDTDEEKSLSVGYNASQENITLTKTMSDTDYETVINRLLQEKLELRKEVAQLEKELDNSKKDNRYLTDRVFKSEDTKRHSYPVEEHGGIAIPDMELPPLEMPQFDFDSLQISTCEKSSGGSIFST